MAGEDLDLAWEDFVLVEELDNVEEDLDLDLDLDPDLAEEDTDEK